MYWITWQMIEDVTCLIDSEVNYVMGKRAKMSLNTALRIGFKELDKENPLWGI